MKPLFEGSAFGSITIDGATYNHDIIIRLHGSIGKRKKKLSKAVYGTSHIVSKDEAKHVYDRNAEKIIVGTGHNGILKLSDEASAFFEKRGCKVEACPTPKAVKRWNEVSGNVIALFHVTC